MIAPRAGEACALRWVTWRRWRRDLLRAKPGEPSAAALAQGPCAHELGLRAPQGAGRLLGLALRSLELAGGSSAALEGLSLAPAALERALGLGHPLLGALESRFGSPADSRHDVEGAGMLGQVARGISGSDDQRVGAVAEACQDERPPRDYLPGAQPGLWSSSMPSSLGGWFPRGPRQPEATSCCRRRL